MADEQLIKPRELPPAIEVYDNDAIMTDDGSTVSKATPVQIVNAGSPVASEVEAIAGTNNTKRMTPLRVRQVLDDMTAPSVLRAQAWAESPTNPDPSIPGSQSAKTWASTAESARDAAAGSASSASGYATAASNAKTDAESARDVASGYATDASNARTAAESARDAAVTAKTAAESARDAASGSASAASGSASAAAGSASAASTSATNAENARTAAETARTQAQTAATNASGSATTASNAKADAENSAMGALATAVALMPSTFDNNGAFFSNLSASSPSVRMNSSLSGFTFVQTDRGMVAQRGNVNTDGIMGPKRYLYMVPGRRYKISVTARHVGPFGATSDNGLSLIARRINADWSPGVNIVGAIQTFPAPDVWQTFSIEWTAPSSGTMICLPFAVTRGAQASTMPEGSFIQVSEVLVQDITETSSLADLYGVPWLDNVSALIANTTLTYSVGSPSSVVAGDYVRTRAEGFSYVVVSLGTALGPTGYHVSTAGGVLLRVIGGEMPVNALGDTGRAALFASELGWPLIIPAGVTEFSGAVDLTKAIQIVGMGKRASEIRFATATGFKVTLESSLAAQQSAVTICGVTITTTDTSGSGYAVNVERGLPVSGIRQPQDEFIDVNFNGHALDNSFWGRGIILLNSRSPRIDKCDFWGRWAPATSTYGNVAIDLRGQTINPKITNSQCAGYIDFVKMTGSGEGLQVDHCQTSLVQVAVNALLTTAGRPQVSITNNHFNTGRRGVVLGAWVQSNITGNLFYSATQGGGYAATDYVALDIEGPGNVTDWTVHHNIFVALQSIPETAVRFASSAPLIARVAFDNNKFIGFDEGLRSDSSINPGLIWHFNEQISVTTPFVGTGLANIQRIEREGMDVVTYAGTTEVHRVAGATGFLSIAGNQVLRGRTTGWGVPSGSNIRTTFAQYTKPGSASATYSQSEMDDLMSAVQTLSARVATLIRDLHINGNGTGTGHGLLGS